MNNRERANRATAARLRRAAQTIESHAGEHTPAERRAVTLALHSAARYLDRRIAQHRRLR
jgi:hypothetical protein